MPRRNKRDPRFAPREIVKGEQTEGQVYKKNRKRKGKQDKKIYKDSHDY